MTDLKELQKKARARVDQMNNEEQTESAVDQHGKSGKQRRPSPLRIGIWIFEFIILMFVLEHFVIRPYWLDDTSDDAAPSGGLKREEIAIKETVEQNKKALRSLPSLTIPSKTHLPSVEALADGSERAQSAQLAVSHKENLPIEVVNSIGIRFRLIPSGTFNMGSPEDEDNRWEGEKQHRRTIEQPFYISQFEVTQEQWKEIMDDNPSRFKGEKLPVEEVTWNDCQRFLQELSRREQVPEGTYRLPTEAEWEYACRAGTESAYYFGSDPERLKDYAVYKGSSFSSPQEVGTKKPNAYGLYNMHGNVWEWCKSKFRPYPETKKYKSLPDWRVIRGGNWYVDAGSCRSANRARLGPSSHGNMLGFRVVLDITPETAGNNDKE
ncbi:MAG: formylglycine-generating enzyme family protein [Verrucomicrobiota bacterium]